MDRLPSLSRPSIPLRALALYALFLGAAWGALQLAGAGRLGLLLGPLAAQIAMAGVVVLGSRTLLGPDPAPARLVPQRRLRAAPLVLVGLGGFLFQASLLTGARFLSAAGGDVPSGGLGATWVVLAFSSLLGAPILEELFFRGILQPVLSRRNVVVGVVATAALFGVAHGFQVPLRALPTFLQGLVLGGLVLVTGRLRAAVVVHALNNGLVLVVALLLFLRPAGLPVAGEGGGPWTVLACGVAALTLVAMGFLGLAREPRIDAAAKLPLRSA